MLSLKNQYKTLTGVEYKPTSSAPTATKQKENQPSKETGAATASASAEDNPLIEKIAQQGEKVRVLKANKAAKVSQTRVVTPET